MKNFREPIHLCAGLMFAAVTFASQSLGSTPEVRSFEKIELRSVQRVPTSPRGDYRGVRYALIQRWIPPSSPLLEKEGTTQGGKHPSLIQKISSHLPLERGDFEERPWLVASQLEAGLAGLAQNFDQPGQQTKEDGLYQRGTRALDNRQWAAAIAAFDEVAKLGGRRGDAALYWKAYAQNKQGARAETLATLAELQKSFPKSRWMKEAKALQVEVRQASGQQVAPESESDEELKLIAINSLMYTDSERALPLLEKILRSNPSSKLKERALFVLAQSGSPKARELMTQIANNKADRDLQFKALRNLGIFGGGESRQTLASIYASSKDQEVKRVILQSYMVAGDRERLLAAAKGESDGELRREAIRQLGVMGAQDALWQLYQSESSMDAKKEILQSMFVGGAAERLIELARNEKDIELRRTAVRTLGLMGAERTGDSLLSMYNSEKDHEVRKEVLQAFFIQGNAKVLVELARRETDPELKKEVVGKLSLMHSKESTEYLMELLNK